VRLHHLWTALYNNAGVEWVTGLIQNVNGDFFIGGFSKPSPAEQSFQSDLTLLSNDGESKWSISIIDNYTMAYGIAATENQGVYLAGHTAGSLGIAVKPGHFDNFVQRYDGSGNLEWSLLIGTSAIEQGLTVASNLSGQLYMAGWTTGSLGATNAGRYDTILSSINPDGTIAWHRQLGSSENDHVMAMGVSTDNSIYITGFTDGNLNNQPNSGGDDAFLSRLNANGDPLWTRQLGGSGVDHAYGILVSQDNNIYITGRREPIATPNKVADQGDAFLAKYSQEGDLLWTQTLHSSSYEYGRSITETDGGHILVTGRTDGNLEGEQNNGGFDAFVSLLDRDGNKIWTSLIGTELNDAGNVILRGQNGIYFLAGMTEGNLDSQSNFNHGTYDGFLKAFSLTHPVTSSSDYAIIESQGNTALLQRPDNSPVVEISGTRYNVSSPWGTPVGAPSSQWQMLAAETIAGSNQILFRNNTFNYLHTWSLDSNWAWTNSFGTITPSSAQGWDLESSFQVDADNDGIIGAPLSNTLSTLGWLTKSHIADEGITGFTPFSFTVTRSGNISQPSSVDWAVQGTGVSPADQWDFEDDRVPAGTIVFAPGESSQTITVNVRGDSSPETDEHFQLSLSNAAGASLDPQSLTAEGLIRNDDTGTWIYDWANAQPLGDTPGVLLATLTRDSFRPGEQPLRITALRIDLSTPGLSLSNTGPISDWQADSRETLTQTTRNFVASSRQDGVPVVAAINTAFFDLTNASQAVPTNLLGFAVSGGELVSPTQAFHPFFLQDPITGARLVREPGSAPDPNGVNVAFAGMSNGIVLWDGLVTGPADDGDPVLNARSGLGLTRDNRFLTLLTVDRSLRSFGGPTYWGAGIKDVGTLLSGFGSYKGMNLDGGGSTQMAWWNPTSQSAQLLNAPLFGQERHVGSNLGIVYQQP